jgi:hypothetical protein
VDDPRVIFEWCMHGCRVIKPCLPRKRSKSLGAPYVMGWRVRQKHLWFGTKNYIFFLSLIFKLNFSPYKNSEQPLQFIFPFRLIHNLMITIYKILNDL